MRFRPLSVHEFTESRDVDWIIKGVIPKSELVVMYGAPGSGKSFLAFDMACGISRGVDWNGLKTKKLRVVVVMAEGSNGVKRRLAAFTKQFGVRLEELDIFFIPAAPNFLEKKDPQDLAAAINALGGVGLVIVDTLARVTAGGNENSGEDMGKALASCGYLYRTTGATIMLIHHSGKNTEAGARGHSSLLGAADAMLEILRSDEDRVMTVAKLKDGEDGREFGFTLLAVSLGFDQDGDDITSCVVEYNTSTKRAISRQLDDKDMEVYDMIADMQKGELAPWLPEITDRVKAVAPHLSRTLLRSVKLLSDKKMIIRGDDDRISLPDSRPSLI
jgi:RecA-family ATPase